MVTAARSCRGLWFAAALAALAPGPALAYHEESPATDYSAYTMDQWEIRLGLWRAELGVHDQVQLGTVYWLWLVKTYNMNVKWAFYERDEWVGSVSLGLAHFDTRRFDEDADAGATFTLVPFIVTGTYVAQPDLRLNLGIGYTHVGIEGSGDIEFNGFIGASTGYLTPTVEWRLGPVLALVLEGRVKLFQTGEASLEQDEQRVDERTTLEYFAEAEADLGTGFQANAILSALWSWDSFNLRLGLGYGHWSLPLVHIFAPQASLIPELDLFWRF